MSKTDLCSQDREVEQLCEEPSTGLHRHSPRAGLLRSQKFLVTAQPELENSESNAIVLGRRSKETGKVPVRIWESPKSQARRELNMSTEWRRPE